MSRLSVENVSFTYGEKPILKNVSLAVEQGELVAILGHNGSGKTTLLRCISGYLTPTAGMVRIGGQAVSSLSARKLAQRMALVPQNPVMEFDFTVRDIVLMGRNPHLKRFAGETDADFAAADAALARTGMTALSDRSVLTLSGGEWQRTIIARAICQKSDVMLLDEPVASLDVKHQIEILRLVRSLCRENGISALCVMHDVNLSAHYSDQILLLKGGETLACGSPYNVVTAPLLQEAYGIEAEVREVQGHPFMIPRYD
jgi:iron complex transport system ATP-binding protein